MKKISIVIACVMVFAACTKTGNTTATAKTLSNVAYGSDAKQLMDIYLPANRTTGNTKILFFIHGGGWTEGDKNDFAPFVDHLKILLPDYAFVNINYRLATATTNKFPTQENDVKTAVDFVLGKTTEYNISQKIALLGGSAGGHLALLHAYKQTSPVKAQAVISFFGPTDLTVMYNNPANPLIPILLSTVLNGTPVQNPALYLQSSPANFVTAQSSPTLLLHGGIDAVVDASQAILLQTKLNAAGVINQLVYYPAEGHGWTGASLLDSFVKIEAFLKANVK